MIISLSFTGKTVKGFPENDTTASHFNFGKKGAYIISENNNIKISGLKSYFITFSFTKKMKIKILDAEGLARFSTFILPEDFDPTYIPHFPKERNYCNVYSNLKIGSFKGSIITKEGTIKDASILQTSENVRMVMVENNLYGNFEKHKIQVLNLEVGDELSIEYNYDVYYKDNFGRLSSFRIFFNGDVYKEKYQLTLSHQPGLQIDLFYGHNATPDSVVLNEKCKVYYWNRTKLSGCIDEPGGIPFLSLPHVIFSIKPYELLYEIPYSFEERFTPFYSLFSYDREMRHLEIAKAILQNVKLKQYLQIRDFVDAECKDIHNDRTGIEKLKKIQNTIVDDFEFANDTDYFKRTDTYSPKIGDDVTSRRVRDINRYNMYVAIIMKLGLNYFTAYVCDRRSGQLDDDYFEPMYNSDYLFAILFENRKVHYIYPKNSRFGYYMDEIPFYFENACARLVYLDDYRDIKKPVNEELRQIQLPHSENRDNTRKSNILVSINTENLSASFNAKISLSGQYSTLCRGLYLYNCRDESVNERYNKKIWELNDQVNLLKSGTEIISREFPFNALVTASYEATGLMKKKGDTISLDLKNWCRYIIYDNIDSCGRQQDFYPDFPGRDSYVYMIKFDKPVSLLNCIDNIRIDNEFGELIIKTKQQGPDAIRITSFFSTNKRKIAADKISEVTEIYDKIEELDKSSLMLRLE